MKTAPPPPPTEHRLKRHMTWARVWLEMALSVLPEGGGLGPFVGWMAPALHERLRFVRALVLRLIFLRAWARAERTLQPNKPAPSWRRPRDPTGALRIAIGCAMRRRLRARGVRAQVVAMLSVLRDAEAVIARLARRLRRGLNSWRRTYAAHAPRALAILQQVGAARALNTS